MNSKSPSEIAFEELAKNIKSDSTLEPSVQEAFLKDLNSMNPNDFAALKELFKKFLTEENDSN